MRFFTKKNQSAEGKNHSKTTKNFFIGSSEAEGEVTSKITLDEFFNDYLDILEQINYEKFIITGKKGTGKSAIGEYIYSLSKNDPNAFCAFIRKDDIDIEKIVQIGKENGTDIQNELLFKWIILTKLLYLINQNEYLTSKLNKNEKDNITKFIERNRGFIDIKHGEIIEIIKTNGFSINIEYFKRIVSAVLNKELKIKEGKAEFHKLLPNLQEVIVNLLSKDANNEYAIIFDDLDINFNVKSQSNKDTLTALIRIVKQFNNEVFGKNKINAKVIILLRDDIVKHLKYDADTAKLFSSYEVSIKWFEDIPKREEDKLKIKQFICDRIQKNFDKLEIPYEKNNVWNSFVNESEFFHGSSGFKYILDHTFYRPRDLILFFKDISKLDYEIPLTKSNINTLIGYYSKEVIYEITNELSIIFSNNEIEQIFIVLRYFSSNDISNSHKELKEMLANKSLPNCEDIIKELFDYSLICNTDAEDNITYKHREKGTDICKYDPNKNFYVHKILKIYFRQC